MTTEMQKTAIQERIEQMVTNGRGYVNYQKGYGYDDPILLEFRLAMMGHSVDDFLRTLPDYGAKKEIIPKLLNPDKEDFRIYFPIEGSTRKECGLINPLKENRFIKLIDESHSFGEYYSFSKKK